MQHAHNADLVVMGWGEEALGFPGRFESALDPQRIDLPSDFLMVKDRGFDQRHILVPTVGGPHSAITREGELITPRGETVFEVGDHVVVFVDSALLDEVDTQF